MTRVLRSDHFDLVIPSPKRVVSIKLEIDLIEEIDRLWRSLGYTSRSEFIREAILYYMQVVSSGLYDGKITNSVLEKDEASTDNNDGNNVVRKDKPYIVIDTATDIA